MSAETGRGLSGPLSNSYPGAVALVAFSLMPYLAISGAVLPLAKDIAKGVGLNPHTFDLVIAISTGAYALGTVLAVQCALHLPARRMLVVYETLFVAASSLAAWAPEGWVFAAGFIVQGLCTSLMLIAAVPPLVTGWPAKKMPVTAVIMNLCIFGAVAAGPSVGSALGTTHHWRPLFVVVAGLALAALVFSLLTYEDDPAQDTDAPIDVTALSLALVGCGAAFVGAGLLQVSHSVRLTALVPLVVGAALLVALVVHQFATRNPLMPVRQASTSVALAGLCIALTASAAAVGIMELVLQALAKSASPSAVALDFLPEFGGAIVVAAIFGALFRTRFTPLLALGGMPAIAASAAIFIARPPLDRPAVAVGAGLLGLGVAASVSPALFMIGFSLKSSMLQRLFALIELLRGVTGFLVAPVLLFVATVVAATPARGTTMGLWVCLFLAVAGFVGGAVLYGVGKGRLEPPDLERWQEQDDVAWSSPPLSEATART